MKNISFKTLVTACLFFLVAGITPCLSYPVQSPRKDIIQEDWTKVYPYLLPEDSEIKPKLDAIFAKRRAILNEESLLKSGFTNAKAQSFSLIVVTKHQDLPGYIFKLYLDDEKYKSAETAQNYLVKRVKGSLLIQKVIDDNKLQHLFKVPKKWIYLLPEKGNLKKSYSYKNFVLVEEDMHILDRKANKKAWKSSQVDKATLIGLYTIIRDAGLLDCTHIDNIPFSEDGRIAFIDTEVSGVEEKRIPFKRLKKALSGDMKHFWYDLIGEN